MRDYFLKDRSQKLTTNYNDEIMTEQRPNRIQFIYAGSVLNNKDQKRYAYINTDNKKEELYKVKLWKSETAGSVIEATKTETGVEAPYEYIGKISDELWGDYLDDITSWSVRERGCLENIRVQSESKEDHPQSISELINQIKEAIWTLNPRQRKNFALWVYNQIL